MALSPLCCTTRMSSTRHERMSPLVYGGLSASFDETLSSSARWGVVVNTRRYSF